MILTKIVIIHFANIWRMNDFRTRPRKNFKSESVGVNFLKFDHANYRFPNLRAKKSKFLDSKITSDFKQNIENYNSPLHQPALKFY